MALPLRELYIEALELFTVEALAAAEWLGLPSACEGWSIGDVVRHAVAIQQANVLAPLAGTAEPTGASSARVDVPAVAAIHTWEVTARAALAAAEGCSDEAARLLYGPTVDLAMHAWDIRWGTARVGLADRLELPERLLAFAEGLPPRSREADIRGGAMFGEARPAPEGASRTGVLMAWSGRRV